MTPEQEAKRYPNAPPKAFDVDLDVQMRLSVNGDHPYHAIEVAEEVAEVMAQNTRSIVDLKIRGAQAILKPGDVTLDDPV